MNLKNIFLIVVITVFTLSVNSCITRVSDKKIGKDKLVENFFETYKVMPERAIRDVYKNSKWLSANIKQADTACAQLSSIINQLGNYSGHEIIKSIKVGESYKMISTLGKYERQPIRFNFVMYKPQDKWQIQSFNFDLNIESELEQNITVAFDY
jgi:hypothetical protein